MIHIDNDAVRAAISYELQDGENVVWSGVQNPRRFIHAFLLKALIPTVWTFAMIFIAAITNADLHWTDPSRWERFQWMGAFVASIGPLGMFASALAFKMQRPTIYFVTNRRAIAISGKGFGRVESYWPDQLNSTNRTERPDGTGDVEFKRVRQNYGSGEFVVCLHGFYGIQDAVQAERHIFELRQNAANSRIR